MFRLGNIFEGGYSAHSFVKRSYGRIDDSIAAIASGDSTDAGTASVIISSLLSAEIAGSQQAARNAADGISILQTFGGAVQSIGDKLIEMARLATQAASGFYSDGQKHVMQLGFEELSDEINDIVDSTQFNGNKLLSSNGQILSIVLHKSTIDINAQNLGIDISELDLTSNAADALAFMKQAIEQTSSYHAYLGGKARHLEKTAMVLQFDVVKAMGFQTSIANTDLAKEIATETIGRIQAESIVLLQIQGRVAARKALQLLAEG